MEDEALIRAQQRNANLAKAREARAAKRESRIREEVPVNRAREGDVSREPMRDFVYTPEEDDDRLKIEPDEIPEGMSYQWVTSAIFGQPQPQRLARFQKQGWTPVPASRHDGKFMPKGYQGHIEVDGLMLHERPAEYTRQARLHEARKARDQIAIKELQLAGGDIPGVSLDTRHASALRTNKINRGFERIAVPEE